MSVDFFQRLFYFGFCFINIAPFLDQYADSFRGLIALCLQLLQTNVTLFAFAVEPGKSVSIKVEAALGKLGSDLFRVTAYYLASSIQYP